MVSSTAKRSPFNQALTWFEKISYMLRATKIPSKDIVDESSFQTSLNAFNFILTDRMMDLYTASE